MTIESEVKTKDKTISVRSVLTRKVRRQMLKDSLGTNKISKAWRAQK